VITKIDFIDLNCFYWI